MELEEREFFVQLIDEASFIAVEEYSIGSWSVQELSKLLACDPSLLIRERFYLLEGDVRRRVESAFLISLDRPDCEANLISWSKSDGLPYRTHARRELILMRNGLKPLAVFSSMVPSTPDAFHVPVHLFSYFVEEGLFVCKTYCEALAEQSKFIGVEVILYALACEAWRLDAYILLRLTARRMGWSESLIRMEGTLLGYSEWQNDAFMAARDNSAPIPENSGTRIPGT